MTAPRRRRARIGVLCVVALVAGGCSMHRHDAATAASAGAAAVPGGAAAARGGGLGDAGALLSTADHARLAAVCARRTATAAGDDGYRLGPDDLVEVRIPDLLDTPSPLQDSTSGTMGRPAVGGAPSFQQGLRIDAHGDINIATLGAVHAAGSTPSELEKDLARRLVRAGILTAPQVSVLVVEYRSRVAAVIGSVERPGVYPVTSSATRLSDLIWLAGGPNREAGRVVEFTPVVKAGEQGASAAPGAPDPAPIRLDMEMLLRGHGPESCDLDPPARAGDVISVAPAGTVQVAGWVDKPGSVPVTRGLTVTGAIAAVGGSVFAADEQNVTVKRVLGPGEERTWTVDVGAIADGRAKDVPLTDGDVVTVPYDGSKLVPYSVWGFAKEMIHVGGTIPLF
jgi:protein involved in polysaccharide export with SLBB domain